VIHGARASLAIGALAALLAVAIGMVVGALAGFYRGWVDELLMRVVEAFQTVPGFVLALAHVAVLGPSSTSSIVAVAVISWTQTARVVRAEFLALRARDFVRAAVALGATSGRVMFVHILPNLASPIIVATTLAVGEIILLESVLSFLGLGIAPPIPSWGNMLTGAQETIALAPQLALYPGLLIFVTVIACNFLGDGLQDALDPRAEKRFKA